jgi:hypothetical protein
MAERPAAAGDPLSVTVASAPPRWTMFAVSVVAICVLRLVLDLALQPLALPHAARLLQHWLYAPPRRT